MNFNDIIVMGEEEYLENECAVESHILKNKDSLVEWCSKNYRLFNPNIYGNKKLFDIGIEFLLNKDNTMYNENDIKFIITYFAEEALKDLNIENVKINFSKGKFFCNYSNAQYNKKNKEITFYLSKFDNLKEEGNSLLHSVMSIFSDIYKIKQNESVYHGAEDFNIDNYVTVLETICTHSRGYYDDNFDKLVKENIIGLYAFDKAVSYLSILTPDIEQLKDKKEIREIKKLYHYNINEGMVIRFKELDNITNDIVKDNSYFVYEYPILFLGYELEGNPKNLKSLTKDYKYFLNVYPSKKKSISNFYRLLICKRFNILEEEFDKFTEDLEKENENERRRLMK
ncbi:MAG: hypothetical protein VZS44_00575 [Bacilli bacterium]|nr:hypothetical protein [Bacilli bacterium]